MNARLIRSSVSSVCSSKMIPMSLRGNFIITMMVCNYKWVDSFASGA